MVDRSAVVIAHQCTIVMHRLKHRTGDHRLGVIWGPIDILKIDPQLVILVLGGIVHSRNLKTKVEAFQAVLRQEGVANGLLMVNGDEYDFDVAKRQVSQSDPVLCLSNVGGASDFMASIFNEFEEDKLLKQHLSKERAASLRRTLATRRRTLTVCHRTSLLRAGATKTSSGRRRRPARARGGCSGARAPCAA